MFYNFPDVNNFSVSFVLKNITNILDLSCSVNIHNAVDVGTEIIIPYLSEIIIISFTCLGFQFQIKLFIIKSARIISWVNFTLVVVLYCWRWCAFIASVMHLVILTSTRHTTVSYYPNVIQGDFSLLHHLHRNIIMRNDCAISSLRLIWHINFTACASHVQGCSREV